MKTTQASGNRNLSGMRQFWNVAIAVGALSLAGTSIASAETLAAAFPSAATVPATSSGYVATGNQVILSLGFAPATGTNLTVVNNTGPAFIEGRFSNLAQGQQVTLTYNGGSYSFVANYYGGNGNDLVLVWKSNNVMSWGTSNVPAYVSSSGILVGKTVVSIAAGSQHCLALCSDGTLAAWGANSRGQLGNGGTIDSSVPVAVSSSGVLSGKAVISIAAGANHSLALCSDGTVYAWGGNSVPTVFGTSTGQLGNNSTDDSSIPVTVSTTGVLSGKTVTAISAGNGHSLAICSDGTLAAWGNNCYGQLGNSTTIDSSIPVAVTTSGTLEGRLVTSIAAGSGYNLALCSDGTLTAWGDGTSGELCWQNTSMWGSSVPINITGFGVLAGKTITSIAAGDWHCLALCSDGTLASWGYNYNGQLGSEAFGYSCGTPTAINARGVLSGRVVKAIAAGSLHSVALCADAVIATWGNGNNLPVEVSTSSLRNGERFAAIALGAGINNSLALAAAPQVGNSVDSDGDGVSDAVELTDGTDPFNGESWMPFSKGLLLCYPFEGNASDTSGNAGDGILYGSPAFVPGVRGQAVSFDGVDDNFARTPVPVTGNPFTYSLWIKLSPSQPFGTWMTVFQQGQSWQYSPILTARVPDATHFEFGGYTWTGTFSSISSPSIPCADPYAWHHVVWTSSPSGNRKLYFDGAVAASTTGQAFGEQNSWLRLGGNIAEGRRDPYLADEFRVYSRGLSDAEVAAMFANQNPVRSNNANLAGLHLSTGTFSPPFAAGITAYDVVVPFATSTIAVAPTVEDLKAAASVRMNGGGYIQVASGATSIPQPLLAGSNTLEVRVTAEDGTLKTYVIAVQRNFPTIEIHDGANVLVDGGSVPLDFGIATRLRSSAKTLTLANGGTDDLLVGGITVSGGNAASFIVGNPAATLLAPGAGTTFTVLFKPGNGGTQTAVIHIASNAAGTANPFDLTLTGTGLYYTNDTDGDAMSDGAEYDLAALGFDWQVSQPELVATLYGGANGAGLYTPTQVQALQLDTPLLAKDPVSGQFKLSLRLAKATDLTHFSLFPIAAPQVTINASGELELRFDSEDGAAFFRIEGR